MKVLSLYNPSLVGIVFVHPVLFITRKKFCFKIASVFSLVWFANRLMADLSVSISSDWSVSSVVDWSNGARDWGWEDWGMDGSVGNETNATGTGSGEHGAQTQESL